jgi:transposase
LHKNSAERDEQAHITNLKDSWNASNHNLNHLPQVITFQRCILCFEIRELNLQALAQRRENSAAAYNVFSSGADLAPSLRFPSYVKPEIMERLNLHNGKHPDAIIKDFTALFDNTRYITHCVAIYRGT